MAALRGRRQTGLAVQVIAAGLTLSIPLLALDVSNATTLLLPKGHYSVSLHWQNDLDQKQSFAGRLAGKPFTGSIQFHRVCNGVREIPALTGHWMNASFSF